MRYFGAILLLSVLGAACRREPSPSPAPSAASAASVGSAAMAAPSAAASGYSEHTGSLSEADFKKLHTLKADAAPPRRGTTVSIGGNKAYLSLPPNAKPPLPAVVVIHEWWGLNEHVMHWADRLAADGYAALAVDLMGGEVATTPDRAMELMKGVDPAKATRAVLAAHDFLQSDARVKAPKTGAIGWCFGGKWSLELAIAEPDLDAAVVYYGHVSTDAARLKTIESPVLGIFGKRDQGIPQTQVDAFDAALEKAGVDRRILRYDADHAFANPSGGRYDDKAASEAWKEARAFLSKHLKG